MRAGGDLDLTLGATALEIDIDRTVDVRGVVGRREGVGEQDRAGDGLLRGGVPGR